MAALDILKNSSVAGLEIILGSDSSCIYNCVVLKKEKNSVTSILQKSDIESMEEAALLIDKKLPLVLVLNGKGILHRKVSVSENDSMPFLLNKVLPNASAADFSIQVSKVNEQEKVVSVIRKSALEGIISDLKKYGLVNITSCFLGPFVVNVALPLMDEVAFDSGTIQSGDSILTIEEKRISGIIHSDAPATSAVLIGTESVPNSSLNSFSAALSYFIPGENGVLDSAVVNDSKSEYTEKRKFETRALIFVFATFIAVIINYLVFDHYKKKGDDAEGQLAMNSSSMHRYNILKLEYERKKDFLERNGLLSCAKSSFYADRLAKDLPAEIRWTDLHIHPPEKRKGDEEEKRITFENHSILIAGNCSQSVALNEWMKSIRKNDWIKEVSLLNYTQAQLKEEGIFQLKILLK